MLYTGADRYLPQWRQAWRAGPGSWNVLRNPVHTLYTYCLDALLPGNLLYALFPGNLKKQFYSRSLLNARATFAAVRAFSASQRHGSRQASCALLWWLSKF